MISLQKINNQRVKKIHLPKKDTRPVKGFEICEEVYANIFLCARKKSGKTSALFKIMKECSDKNTIFIIFCSTCYKDPNWIQIRKYFEKKKMEVNVFTSIYENGEDQLDKLIVTLKEEAKQKEEDDKEEVEESNVDRCDDLLLRLHNLYQEEEIQESEKKPRKSKYQAPENF